ncbi:MAG: transglycosylase SLT domain-containing protein [Cyanobacteria bacterium J06627_8]
MHRRLGVYRTFLTGILIGLFYAVIVSDNASQLPIFSDQGIIDQSVLVLTFSGILGGVLYTIVVDGIVEMPRFLNDGSSFEAGLFGDILLGIAGAFILEFLTSSIQTTGESSFVLLAAKGMIGGYGSKALMNVALNRFLHRLENVTEKKEEAEKEVADLERRLLDGQRLMDQLSLHIEKGLSALELEELRDAIQQASPDQRAQIFKLVKEFRSMSSRSEVLKAQTQRMIPIFEALVDSDSESHEYHAQLAYAYKDAANPNFQAAITHLNQAIRLRTATDRAFTWKYELNRAIAMIQSTVGESRTYKSSELTADAITRDLLTVTHIRSLDAVLENARKNNIPTPILDWLQANAVFLETHSEAAPLLQSLQQALDRPVNTSTLDQPSSSPEPSSKTVNTAPVVSLTHGRQATPPTTTASTAVTTTAHSNSEHADPDNGLERPAERVDTTHADATHADADASLHPEGTELTLNDIRTVIEREVTGVLSLQDWTPDLFLSVKRGLVYLEFLDANDRDIEAFQVAWAQFKASVDRGGSNRIGRDSAALFLNALELKANQSSLLESAEQPTEERASESSAPTSASSSLQPSDTNPSIPEVIEWDDAPIADIANHSEATDTEDLSMSRSAGHSFSWRSLWDDVLSDVPTTGASALTSQQDGLAFNGLLASNQMARQDLPQVKALIGRFCRAAAKYEVPAPLLAAIASRESRCGKLLDEHGLGDHGNAFGIMQIDKRHHTPSGLGGDPASQAHLDQSAEILVDNIKILRSRLSDWEEPYLLKAAVAAYNFGPRNVHTRDGIDRGTTGDDYSSDVIARAKFYISTFEDTSVEDIIEEATIA